MLSEQNSHFQGLTIGEISRRRGTDPETTVMDLVLEEHCQATMSRVFRQTDDLTMAVVHPLTMLLALAGIDECDWTPQYRYWTPPAKMDDGGKNLLE